MAKINNKVLIIIGAIFALIGWVVALGGVAKLNDLCNNEWRGGSSAKDCSDKLSYLWWGIWFGFFLTVVILVLTILGNVEAWSSTLQAFCAACLSVTMFDTNATYVRDPKYAIDALQAAMAGFIILSIGLMLLIVFLGMGSAGVNVSVSVAENKTSPVPGKAASTPTQIDNA